MKKYRNGKSQFLAHAEVITKLVSEGQTAIYIYERLSDESSLAISYRQFLRYIRELKSPVKTQKASSIKHEGQQNRVQPSPQPPSINSSRRQTRILHNPTMTDELKKEIFGE
ncbi:TraK family protein [Enterobacter ludwigii]